MPNWCWSRMQVKANKTKINNFYLLLKEWTSKNYVANGFGTNWIGNIVGNSKMGSWINDEFVSPDGEIYQARGTLDDYYVVDSSLIIYTTTAWSPKFKIFMDLFAKYFENYELIYETTEEGCGFAYTNDPDNGGKYSFEIWEPPENFNLDSGTYSLDELEAYFQEIGFSREQILQNNFDWCCIMPWEYCDYTEFYY